VEPGDPPSDARRENPVSQGARYGAIGCIGVLTFIFLGYALLVVVFALAD
jgi:hypothetical protein